MRAVSWRTVLALAVAVSLSLTLFAYFSRSPYIFALGLALGAYLARITTFKAGVLFGMVTAFPLGLYLSLSGVMPADSSILGLALSVIVLVGFGGIYCGIVAWLINSLKRGRIFFS